VPLCTSRGVTISHKYSINGYIASACVSSHVTTARQRSQLRHANGIAAGRARAERWQSLTALGKQECHVSLIRRSALSCTPGPPLRLPSLKVNEAPLSYTAVDYDGPMYVRGHHKEAEGCKVWICLFTCCTTRATHLELVLDLSTPTFIRCPKKFAARWGLPKKVVSDNAKTFKAVAKAMNARKCRTLTAAWCDSGCHVKCIPYTLLCTMHAWPSKGF
jgi:hypothetical protein